MEDLEEVVEDLEEVGEESYILEILDRMSEMHNKILNIPKYQKKTFPEEFHPRRHQLYRSFTPNNDMYFSLRSHGVPVLTAYFLCEPINGARLLRQLEEKECLETEDALSVIKNI